MRLHLPARRARTLFTAMVLALACACAFASDPVVAAASDLKFALEEVAQAYKQQTQHAVALAFGSSGTFATQIRNGAPFQIFLSADEDYVLKLHAEGYTHDRGALYAIGRLAIVVPPGSTLQADGELKGLAQKLKAGGIKRFAIANPEHAPYGRRAEEALRHAGLWDAIRPALVL